MQDGDIGRRAPSRPEFRPFPRRPHEREEKDMKLLAAIGLAATMMLYGPAQAQDFPTRPITLVNPYSAGGPADLIGRTIADAVSKIIGQPVVVENRPGAATAIAATYVAQADPDG